MTEETTAVQNNMIREESSAPARANFELLSDDTFLNSNYNEATEEAKPTEITKEDASKDEVKDLGLEPETKVEEVKTETTETKEEVTSETETLDLEPLSLEDTNSNEPEDGSWAYIAKLDGLELKEDSLEAYKEAITAPYEEKLREIEYLTTDKLLSKFEDPNVKMVFQLAEAGLTFDEIVAPFTKINEFKAMPALDLVRKNLELTHTDWTPDMIDTEMEILTAVDGRLEHEHRKIIVELDNIQREEQYRREDIVNNYKVNAEKYAMQERVQNLESVSRALDNMSEFMGSPLTNEVKQGLTERMNNGKYDQMFNDPIKKAEFIAYIELGQKAQKNLEAKSYAKGRLEITKKLHNTPPLTSGGAGKSITANTEGNFERLKGDTYLNG
jgi:Rps23 Pro-64 3,4-dihydroxylase Tpa1-like proline 4-hydroxylase